MPSSEIDWAAVRRRLRFIGSALELAPTEVEGVIAELIKGNELRKLAGGISNQLPLPLEDERQRER